MDGISTHKIFLDQYIIKVIFFPSPHSTISCHIVKPTIGFVGIIFHILYAEERGVYMSVEGTHNIMRYGHLSRWLSDFAMGLLYS